MGRSVRLTHLAEPAQRGLHIVDGDGAKVLRAICSNKTQVPARVRFADAYPSPLEGDA
jgi:hypothetical protein